MEFTTNDLFGRAAELAFYFLFALFPLIFLMMTLFGLFASHNVELQKDFLSFFADFLPPTAFRLLRIVDKELITHASNIQLTNDIVSALWCTSGGICSMISALNVAHHVRDSRSWCKVRAIALGLAVLISVLLLMALFFVLFGSHLVDRLGAQYQLHPVVVLVWKAIQWPAAIVFVSISCSLIYHCGPDLKKRRRWYWLTLGSAFGAIVWIVASFGFRVYLHFFNTYSTSYGSLGAVMILLIWLYVAGLTYLIGGEINAEIEHAATGER